MRLPEFVYQDICFVTQGLRAFLHSNISYQLNVTTEQNFALRKKRRQIFQDIVTTLQQAVSGDWDFLALQNHLAEIGCRLSSPLAEEDLRLQLRLQKGSLQGSAEYEHPVIQALTKLLAASRADSPELEGLYSFLMASPLKSRKIPLEDLEHLDPKHLAKLVIAYPVAETKAIATLLIGAEASRDVIAKLAKRLESELDSLIREERSSKYLFLAEKYQSIEIARIVFMSTEAVDIRHLWPDAASEEIAELAQQVAQWLDLFCIQSQIRRKLEKEAKTKFEVLSTYIAATWYNNDSIPQSVIDQSNKTGSDERLLHITITVDHHGNVQFVWYIPEQQDSLVALINSPAVNTFVEEHLPH